jgi:ribosomal protein L12E/L44/L45/RPP1/RPP2
MTKLKAGLISGLLVAGVATPFLLQQQTQNRLRAQNDSLRAQVTQMAQVEAENARLSNLVSETKSPVPTGQMDELLRLRAQVGDLKRQLAEATQAAARLKQAAKEDAQAASETAQEKAELQKTMIARMNDAKQLMLAFYKYAGRDGQIPTNFDQVAGQLPQGLDTNRFEILYHGSFSAVTNPASTIVVREIEAHPTPDGTWVRTYGFADGHTEVRHSADGDFTAWEQQHGVPAQ